MKFLKSYKVVHSDRLYQGKFKYKLVISSSLSSWFRGGDLAKVDKVLVTGDYYSKNASVLEKTYVKTLCDFLKNLDDWQVRVETPNLSVYLNSPKDLESLVKLSSHRVKYVSIPDPDTESKLVSKTILVKNLEFDFKVTLGSTRQNYSSFVNWCADNPKIRMPKRAVKDLSKNYSHGGGYFYVKDAKSLTMVKMFLGSTITRVEHVVRA